MLEEVYRPKRFEDVVGNKEKINSFKNIISEPLKRPNVFLLSGPSGVGKTTLARLSATLLGANASGIKEYNMANHTGVDHIRDTIEREISSPSIGSNVKVIILDECHQCTGAAQNALLKPLEDCGRTKKTSKLQTYVFLCTTEKEKLLPTLRNRCMSFELELVTSDEVKITLDRINSQEGMNLSDEVVRRIADRGAGSPRYAIKLLDKCRGVTSVEGVDALAGDISFGMQESGMEYAVAGELMKAFDKKDLTLVLGLLKKYITEGKVNHRSLVECLVNRLGAKIDYVDSINQARAIGVTLIELGNIPVVPYPAYSKAIILKAFFIYVAELSGEGYNKGPKGDQGERGERGETGASGIHANN